jgi:5'-phosphate synthase pdxT subunit
MNLATEKCVVGVLALQGAFREHLDLFKAATQGNDAIDFQYVEVRTERELNSCDALVVPGGESTSMSLIAERTNMLVPLQHFISSNKPIWGTCAGLIFLSKQIINGRPDQKALGAIDIEVKRNAFGRQQESFEACLDFSSFITGVDSFPTIFIRAPVISKVLATPYNEEYLPIGQINDDGNLIIYSSSKFSNEAPVEVLHSLESGLIVAAKQGNILVTSFHPELTDDYRFHKWFIDDFVLKRRAPMIC